jgi:hypothetical protein
MATIWTYETGATGTGKSNRVIARVAATPDDYHSACRAVGWTPISRRAGRIVMLGATAMTNEFSRYDPEDLWEAMSECLIGSGPWPFIDAGKIAILTFDQPCR